MAEVILFNAARSQAIEDNAIESGFVDVNGKLILVKHNGTQVEAGNVVGPQGPSSRYELPYNGSTAGYLRIATLDGVNASNGAHYNFMLSGMGNFNAARRSTLLVHASQRGSDFIDLKVWGWDIVPNLRIYTRKLSTFFFEIWVFLPSYQIKGFLTELASWHSDRYLDSFTTTAPSNLVEVPIRNSDYSPQAVVSDRADSLSDTTVVKGLLPATYRYGNTKVKINGVLSSDEYSWLTPYRPEASREVRLIKTASGYMISGQIDDGYKQLPLNAANWSTYGERGSGTWAGLPRAVKLPSGLVVLDGMLCGQVGVTIADGSVIATLPVGFRPDNDCLFPVEVADQARCVYISAATGTIRVYGSGWPSNTWLTISGIAFWAAGVAQWTNVGSGGSSWGASFGRNAGWAATYGEPGFWKDPYGFVWFRGLAQVTAAVSADNTPIIALPSTHRSSQGERHRATGNQAYAGLGAGPTSGLNWKPNSPGTVGAHISLASAVLKTADADALNVWQPRQPSLLGSWVPNGGGNQVPNYLLREDGLRITCGLIAGGNNSSTILILESPEFWPRTRTTLPLIATNARGRATWYTQAWDADVSRGALYLDSGGGGWVSLDSRMWVP